MIDAPQIMRCIIEERLNCARYTNDAPHTYLMYHTSCMCGVHASSIGISQMICEYLTDDL